MFHHVWFYIFGCRTYAHDIWGSSCTPRTLVGHWPYPFPLLWPIKPHSCIWPRFPIWHCLIKSGWEMKVVSDPPSEKHFLICEILLLRPWSPLAPVALGRNKLPVNKVTHTTPMLPPLYSSCLSLEIYFPIHPFLLRVPPKHAYECPRMLASACWLHYRFYFYGLIFWFHRYISDQSEPLVSLVNSFSRRIWVNLYLFWYQELSHLGTQVVE